jgi:hypothetical protein
MNEDLMQSLMTLLKELADPIFVELDDYTKEKFYQKLNSIYSNKDFRHSYAELSEFSENYLTPDSRDILVNNLDLILFFANDNYQQNSVVLKGIAKLADHLQLEALRLARIESIKRIGIRAEDNRKEAEKLYAENLKELNEMGISLSRAEKELKDINSQLVSVLGIFSAVVIAFFGGLSYLTSVFSNLHQLSGMKPIVALLIIGLVLFDVLVCLFIFIEKMVNKENAPKIGLITIINVIMVLLIAVSTILWFSGFNPDKSYENNDSDSFVAYSENS